MDKTIYIVYGSSGEHGDYIEWSILAYMDKKKAEEHVKSVQEYADAWYKSFSDWIQSDKESVAHQKFDTPLDPDPDAGSWGTDPHCYGIRELKLVEGRHKKEEGKEDKLLSCPAGPVNPFSS